MLPSTHDVMTWRHDVIVTCKAISGAYIVTCNAITGAIGHRNINPNVNKGFHHTGKSLEHLTHMLQKCHDVMSWRHDVIVTCKTISGTNQHINLIPNLFKGFSYMGRSWATLQHVAVNPWRHDMTSWRHFVTCKTISGANQNINLITNSFPGFYYTGRSLCHFTTCCRQPMTSWHDVMESWRYRDM